jgi:hypothetical protein
MSSGQSEPQLSVAEFNRKIVELGHEIALSPRNATAYRSRGLLYGKIQDFDHAIVDFDRALALNPNDASAYYLRGLAWHRKKDPTRAIADYDKAIELDPPNEKFYRDHRAKAEHDAPAVHPAVGARTKNATSAPSQGLTGFFKRLAQYYAEFLSTDFKKQRLPRRRLQNADAQGRLIGIPLRKYPGFQQKLWEDLAKPIGLGLSFTVARGSWRAELPKAIVETTATYIAQVTQKDVDTVVDGVMKNALRLAKQKGDDPDIAFEQFIEEVRASLARGIIAPLLGNMEGFFARTENKPIESIRELEDQLSARLASGIESSSGAAFSKLLVEGAAEPLEVLLRDQLEINLVRAELGAFFATFTAADFYVDLSDLVRSSRLVENTDFYMHVGEVHHSGHVFPIFYVPFTAERTEQGFKIASEPRLYVNKRAMDYVAQEIAKAEGRPTAASMLRERIFYLTPDQSPINIAQKLFDDLAGSFNLRAEIDFKAPRDQKVSSSHVVATNRLSFSLFDRSDESMVNDYEALQTGIEAGGDVVDFFKSLIDDFLLKIRFRSERTSMANGKACRCLSGWSSTARCRLSRSRGKYFPQSGIRNLASSRSKALPAQVNRTRLPPSRST